MASCVRNIRTKNYQNLLIGFQVTVENIGDVFWDTVHFSFMHPYTFYGVEIYTNTYTLYLNKFIKLNNKLLKILQQKDSYCINIELCANFDILFIAEFHCFQIPCIIHKLIYHKTLLATAFYNYFTKNYEIF